MSSSELMRPGLSRDHAESIAARARSAGFDLGAALASVFVLVLTGVIYTLTLAPTFGSFDSAELIAGAHSLGIIHAPGYPLYLTLGHLAAKLPWGSAAFNVNLLSALFGSLAALVIFQACLRLSGALWGSLLATLLLVFSRLFWSQAVIAEVYTLSALHTAGLVLAAVAWDSRPSRPLLVGLAFLYGLGLTHHLSAAFFAPGLAWLVLLRGGELVRDRRTLLWAAAAMAAPVLIYLYLPIRFLADPPLNYVRDYFDVNLATPGGIAWMVSGRMFSEEVFGLPLPRVLANLGTLTGQVWVNLLGAGLLVALFGFWELRSRLALAGLLALSAISIFFTLASYNVVDNSQMLLPVLVVLTPAMAFGLSRISKRMLDPALMPDTLRLLVRAGLALGISALVIWANWSFADRHEDRAAERFARAVMDRVEPNSLILAQWTSATPLVYLQVVEGARPDVEVLDRGLFFLGIRDRLARAHRLDLAEFQVISTGLLHRRVWDALATRTVYLMEDDPLLREAFCLQPLEGEIFLVLPKDSASAGCSTQAPSSSALPSP